MATDKRRRADSPLRSRVQSIVFAFDRHDDRRDAVFRLADEVGEAEGIRLNPRS